MDEIEVHLSNRDKKIVKRNFIRKCGNNGCRGFLNNKWNCGLCNTVTCHDCHEVKNENHECKESNLETAKLLKKDTKSCPKCGVLIFKIDGCNQIFCTSCHVAFCWKTGNIETTIHNPHYFEWLRQTGRDERAPNEIQCGRELNHYFLSSIPVSKFKNISYICANINHLSNIFLPRFNYEYNNEELRIKFLLNEIDENIFKLKIQQNYKKSQYHKEISSIIGMIVASTIDIIYRYVYENIDYSEYKKEFDFLQVYANEHLEEISNIYQYRKYQFTSNFLLTIK